MSQYSQPPSAEEEAQIAEDLRDDLQEQKDRLKAIQQRVNDEDDPRAMHNYIVSHRKVLGATALNEEAIKTNEEIRKKTEALRKLLDDDRASSRDFTKRFGALNIKVDDVREAPLEVMESLWTTLKISTSGQAWVREKIDEETRVKLDKLERENFILKQKIKTDASQIKSLKDGFEDIKNKPVSEAVLNAAYTTLHSTAEMELMHEEAEERDQSIHWELARRILPVLSPDPTYKDNGLEDIITVLKAIDGSPDIMHELHGFFASEWACLDALLQSWFVFGDTGCKHCKGLSVAKCVKIKRTHAGLIFRVVELNKRAKK
jgi:hypothetical protein